MKKIHYAKRTDQLLFKTRFPTQLTNGKYEDYVYGNRQYRSTW